MGMLTGCVSMPVNHVLAPNERLPEGEALVFGQVVLRPEVPQGGELIVYDTKNMNSVIDFIVSQRLKNSVNFFTWRLPPGEYVIAHYCCGGSARIGVGFRIESAQSPVYIGNLEIGFDGRGVLVGVTSNYESSVTKLDAMFSSLNKPATTSLMVPESSTKR
jgi:hypothetical protein